MTDEAKLLLVADGQLGVVEKGGKNNNSGNIVPYWDWWDALSHEHDQGQSWCGAFVSSCFDAAGMRLPSMDMHHGPGFIYCPGGEAWFRAQGRLRDVAHAEPGDVAFFHFPGEPNEANHTGIVESVDLIHRTITCIEGNTTPGNTGAQSNGGGVYRRTRSWSVVRSVGHPNYPATEADVTAGTKTVNVVCQHATGKSAPTVVPGVKKASVLGWGALAGDDGSIAKVALSRQMGPNGEAMVVAELATPTQIDITVVVVVSFNP